ncbi:hypothetical protein LCGC14_0542650 [marine sediment metagenome]|uniref:Uncharacterized protein n=1 Tax=marine sediment metagenome TaxID=412755 RepID=A0A0F9UDQ8_9ZZZZ
MAISLIHLKRLPHPFRARNGHISHRMLVFNLWNIMFEKYNILFIKKFVSVFEAKTR